MISQAEIRKRQITKSHRLEASSAPRKKKIVVPSGIAGKVDARREKARSVVALLYGWMETAEEQEKRRIAGLSWAPLERYRDVERAQTLLNELVADMRRDL